MITMKEKFDRLLSFSKHKDREVIARIEAERDERVDLLDKFAGTEGFEEQIEMLEDDISRIDAALECAK